MPEQASSTRTALPEWLKPLFWEYDFRRLTWEADRDLIMARVLSAGDWDTVTWLLALVGKDGLRSWLTARKGRGLEPRQLRFWEVVLDLPHREVTQWIELREYSWANRTRP